MNSLLKNEKVEIVSVCDPNKYSTDYLDWSEDGIKNVEDLPNSAELRSVDLPQPESEKENDEQLSLSEVATDSQNESESTENEDEKG